MRSILLSLLLITASAFKLFAQESFGDKHIQVALRKIGHEVLLLSNDTTSRVMPLINKEGICHQCTGLNNKFNPQQDTQVEINKIKMVKEARKKNFGILLDLRLQIAKTIDPLQSEGTDLHNYLLENSPKWAKRQLLK